MHFLCICMALHPHIDFLQEKVMRPSETAAANAVPGGKSILKRYLKTEGINLWLG